ncbi:MAG: YidC/Oxa1 family insertase periplasmic-domain containing protein [Lentisphaeria bacterium]|nr:YidC/Oxa1 family insertase periplasmic-domain containing protein [Lentisphaeria bacterium]
MDKQDKVIVFILCVMLGAYMLFSGAQQRPKTTAEPAPITETEEAASTQSETVYSPDSSTETPLEETVPELAKKITASLDRFVKATPLEPISLDYLDEASYLIDPNLGAIIHTDLHKHLNQERDGDMLLGGDKFPALSLQIDETKSFSNPVIVEQTEQKVVIERQIIGSNLIVQQSWEIAPELHFTLFYNVKFYTEGTGIAYDLSKMRISLGSIAPLVGPQGFFNAGGIDQAIEFINIDDSTATQDAIHSLLKFDDEDKSELANQDKKWLGIMNKFFVQLLMHADGTDGKLTPLKSVRVETPIYEKTEGESPTHYITASVQPQLETLVLQDGITKEFNYKFYSGPKNYDYLKTMGHNAHQVMNYGILLYPRFDLMRGVAWGIYWLIDFLYSFVGNYGIAIILSTIIIRGLFWPVTHKSTVWSQKMKILQPEMQEIRKKFQNDPMQMNQATMELYRKHGVNPLAGCLPMFIQIPVFFALFNVLRSTIDWRHQGFLWIDDLTMPDQLFMITDTIPFNILPLLMAGAMLLQQKMMPTSSDPMQQKMMLFMSFMISIFCYSMPAGLTLYWTVSNLFTIFQFKVTHTMLEKKPVQTKAGKTAKPETT